MPPLASDALYAVRSSGKDVGSVADGAAEGRDAVLQAVRTAGGFFLLLLAPHAGRKGVRSWQSASFCWLRPLRVFQRNEFVIRHMPARRATTSNKSRSLPVG